jgi:ubiquinone/menaquinone biosynthesis C-methylase UbiE
MSKLDDPTYLRNEQYRDPTNLTARMALHARFSTNPQGWQQWVFDQLPWAPATHILELGCGPGRLWAENAARIPPGWALTLSDFSPGMLHEARRNLTAQGQAARFVAADAQALPFADAAFDAVIANHMLYHVPDRARALAEIHRILRPGGAFVAATNGVAHLREMRDLLNRFHPAGSYWGEIAFPPIRL